MSRCDFVGLFLGLVDLIGCVIIVRFVVWWGSVVWIRVELM